MAYELTTALIGGGAAIVGAALPLAWTAITEALANPKSSRRFALLGRWEGRGVDVYIEDPVKPKFEFDFVFTFTSVGNTVKASATVKGSAGQLDQLSLVGKFYNEDYLQLSYSNENLTKKQLGVLVLRLGSGGTSLSGFFTGFSPRRETIIGGTFSAEKRA